MWKRGLLRASRRLQRPDQSRNWSTFKLRSTCPQSLIAAIPIKTKSPSSPPPTGAILLLLGTVCCRDGKAISECHENIPTKAEQSRKNLINDYSIGSDESQTWLPEYSSEEVSQRNGQNNGGRIWMSYNGFVYDVTDFIPKHPGGTERISRAAGSAIEPFWYLHQQHFDTDKPMNIMGHLVVGKLKESDQDKVDAQLECLQEELDGFRLVVDLSGIVGETIVELSMDDLKRLPRTDLVSQVGCSNSSNPVSTSMFGGVQLKDILRRHLTSSSAKARKLIFHAMDGETVTVKLDQKNYDDILVCYEMDGAPLTKKRGFPLRIIIPGKRAVKWVQRIEFGP